MKKGRSHQPSQIEIKKYFKGGVNYTKKGEGRKRSTRKERGKKEKGVARAQELNSNLKRLKRKKRGGKTSNNNKRK